MGALGCAGLLIPMLADAEQIDVELLIYHADVHPETGEPCGGAIAAALCLCFAP